ncbi:MAG: isochorismatase family protein [Pseudomonadota bacterium]|nr:isochorismatase family protein [Pseudomonadota bacterium]
MSIPKIPAYDLPELEGITPNRVDWQPDPARAVLLIHDMQDYFLNFYDQNAAPIPQMLDNLITLRHFCASAGVPVVYTAQPPQQTAEQRGLLQDWWGPGLTAKPDQAGIVADLAPEAQDIVLTKWRYSAFQQSPLRQIMQEQQRDQLIIGGIYAHIGCMTTAVDAFMQDIQPFFVADALADFSQAEHQMALNWVAQRCGVVLDTNQVIRQISPPLPIPESEQALLASISQLLGLPPGDLQADDDLLLMGLDSIRLMNLVAGWRYLGLPLEFNDLAERPTLAEWWDLLQTLRG